MIVRRPTSRRVAAVLPIVVGIVALGCAEDGDDESADAEADVAPIDPTAFAVQAPGEVIEGVRFILAVTALISGNAVATEYDSEIQLSGDWGDVSAASLPLTAGRGTVQLSLNREGLTTLRLADGTLEQTASVRVKARPYQRQPVGPAFQAILPAGPNPVYHWTAGGVRGGRPVRHEGKLWLAFTSPADPTLSDQDDRDARLGYAWSEDDGASWTLEPKDAPVTDAGALGLLAIANPLLLPSADGGWHLWLSGLDGPAGAESWRIVHFTSPDMANWIPEPCLALNPSPGSPWMGAGVRDPAILVRDDQNFTLYFVGLSSSQGGGQLGMAIGNCETGWNSPALALTKSAAPAWDSHGIEQPFVWREGSVYKLLFGARGSSTGASALGYATSSDGLTWILSPNNPTFSRESSPTSPSQRGVNAPTLLFLPSGQAMLFFEGRSGGGRASLGRALGPAP